MVPGPSGDEIAMSLRRHGIPVISKPILGKRTPNAAGEEMLRECVEWDADLLVKGGYTNSRLRQMIFGGATSRTEIMRCVDTSRHPSFTSGCQVGAKTLTNPSSAFDRAALGSFRSI